MKTAILDKCVTWFQCQVITKQKTTTANNFIGTGVIFGASFQSMYIFWRKRGILRLFELMEANFEYSSQTGLQEVNMEGYIKKGMLLIYWWGLVLVLAVVCLVGGPLSVKNERYKQFKKKLYKKKLFLECCHYPRGIPTIGKSTPLFSGRLWHKQSLFVWLTFVTYQLKLFFRIFRW